jgi:hypothetical protein
MVCLLVGDPAPLPLASLAEEVAACGCLKEKMRAPVVAAYKHVAGSWEAAEVDARRSSCNSAGGIVDVILPSQRTRYPLSNAHHKFEDWVRKFIFVLGLLSD